MCISLCIYIYIYTCRHIHTYMYTYTYIHVYTWMHACMHTYRHTYMHACIHTYIHVYAYTQYWKPNYAQRFGASRNTSWCDTVLWHERICPYPLMYALLMYVNCLVLVYGQFSEFHVCLCGLDPGNLKFDTVRTNKQHLLLGFETLNLRLCDLKLRKLTVCHLHSNRKISNRKIVRFECRWPFAIWM